jgi:eukaryotic-like serine/threonine-protein kinase
MTPVLADRYELQELLGSGGMARVHAARDRRLGRRVAVKLVREDLVGDGRSRERLLREARSAASFHHPNSVAVFDVGEHDRQPFIVMELIDGESLADRLSREGRLRPAEVVGIGVGVLAALEAAHERGLVHRDIKPANVLLPQPGGVKLADFGIAKAVADTAGGLTAVGDVMGTPNYLSPEQAAGQSAVPASDLYALGVVLYECLAGRPPFSGENPLAVALAHQREPTPPLRRVAPDVPEDLAAVVEQALAKDLAVRFADAPAMRRALEGLADPAAAPTVALAEAPAHAATTVLMPDDGDEAGPYPATAVLPADAEPSGEVASEEAPPLRRRRTWLLLLVLALVLAGLLAAGLLGSDPTLEEPPQDDPADEPADEPPAEEEPAEPAPEEPPADEEPPERAPEEPPEEPEEEDPSPEDPPGEDPPPDEPPEDEPPEEEPTESLP